MVRKEKPTKIFDGDTFLTNRRFIPVRLDGVDTPEKREPGYKEAKKALEDLIKNKEVTIETVARDKYRRPLVQAKVGNQSVNKAMEKYKKK
jgi:endonuclease YncB( thermonuclease family)